MLKSSQEIEYLKGFAILALLVIHGVGIYSPFDTLNGLFYCKLWIDQYSRFAIPLFFVISGFVLHLQYPGGQVFDLKGFYIKRFVSVVPSYAILTVVYWVTFEVYNFNAHGDPFDLDLPRLIRHLIFSDASSHFWFYAILFQLYFLYPFLLKVYNHCHKKNYVWLLMSLVFFLQVLDCTFDTRADLTKLVLDGVFPEKLGEFKGHLIHYPVFISRIFYFVLGMFIQHHYLRIKEMLTKINVWIVLAAILVMTTIKTNFDFHSFQNEGFYAKSFINFYGVVNILINILNMLIFMKISFRLKLGNAFSRALDTLGGNSNGIYLVHMLFVSGLMIWFGFFSLDPNQWFYYPALFIGTTAMSFWVVEKLSRSRYSQFFIGVHKQKISL